ncbi:MAG: hypothetical protein HY753_09605 [Nitrospirae bacterium]|nr:hypothetical protein [Nitrospirota bacterium]
MYLSFIRMWLIGVIFILPFQFRLSPLIQQWSNQAAAPIISIDRITIVLFLVLAIREFYKNKEFPDPKQLILLAPIIALSATGVISGIVNGNSLLMTGSGVFSYVENFLVIFIYATFFSEVSTFKKILRIFLVMMVFLVAVAIIQEFWALYFRYVLGLGIDDERIYLLADLQNIPFADIWRSGIYRASSLFKHFNILGFLSLFIFTIYINLIKRANPVVVFFLYAGIFLSVSRMVYTGFALMVVSQIYRERKWLITLVIPLIIILSIDYIPTYHSKTQISDARQGVLEGGRFREITREKAMTIWKDHILLGRGPGAIQSINRSPAYEEYNFGPALKEKIRVWGGIDQFWPIILAEIGVAGAVIFSALFILLFVVIYKSRQEADSDEVKGLFEGLLIYTAIIIVSTISTNLHIRAIFYIYSAFLGMGLGYQRRYAQ